MDPVGGKMKALIVSLIALTASISNAQVLNPNSTEARLRNVERQVYDLQQRNMQLESRVLQIEEHLYGNPMPLPPSNGNHVCGVQNTSSHKVFLGKSLSRIEAEAIAKNSCASGSSFPQYCVAYECSQEDLYEHTCRISNTSSQRDFLGRSKSVTEAKAIARNGCASGSSFPQYCDMKTLVCD